MFEFKKCKNTKNINERNCKENRTTPRNPLQHISTPRNTLRAIKSNMDGKYLFCVSVLAGDHRVYGPEWKEVDHGKTLVDLFVQACGNRILGQQVQVLVSRERSFLEAAVVQVCTPLQALTENCQSYVQFVMKHDEVQHIFDVKPTEIEKDIGKRPSDLLPGPTTYTHHTSALTDWKSQLTSYESFREKYLSGDHVRETSVHNLTTRPSFEHMTVQEICDEIRRMKSSDRPVDQLKSPTKPSKTTPSTPSTPTPSTTTTTLTTPTKPTEPIRPSTCPPPRCKSARESRSSPSPRKYAPISDRLSALAQPRRRLINEKINNIKNAREIKPRPKVSPREKTFTTNPPSPKHAKEDSPGKRYSMPPERTFVKSNKNMSTTGNKKMPTNGTFVKRKPENKEYFVEYFSQGKREKETDSAEKRLRSQSSLDISQSTSNGDVNIDSLFSSIHQSRLHDSKSQENLIDFIGSPTKTQECLKNTPPKTTDHFCALKSPLIESGSINDSLKSPSVGCRRVEVVEPSAFPLLTDQTDILKKSTSTPSLVEATHTLSKTPDSLEHNNSREEIVYKNFRGIKFTSNNTEQLNRTFVLERKTIDQNISLEEQELSIAVKRRSTSPQPLLDFPSPPKEDHRASTPLPGDLSRLSSSGVKSPDKPRKHWGNNVEGVDNFIISSLQTFSSELRSTSETVSTNLRKLYENWQLENEGASALDEISSLLPKKSPRVDKQNDGIATVFRNLRKIEIKLKTMEQATLAMVTQLDEDKQQNREVSETKKARSSIGRAKSFKWRELKSTVKQQSRVKTWTGQKNNDSLNTSSDSD